MSWDKWNAKENKVTKEQLEEVKRQAHAGGDYVKDAIRISATDMMSQANEGEGDKDTMRRIAVGLGAYTGIAAGVKVFIENTLPESNIAVLKGSPNTSKEALNAMDIAAIAALIKHLVEDAETIKRL